MLQDQTKPNKQATNVWLGQWPYQAGNAYCSQTIYVQTGMLSKYSRWLMSYNRYYTCTGVFVMVTIGLSTVSVVTSILIVRLSGVSTPLPIWLRHGVFRTIARLMCVHLSPPYNKSAVAPGDGDGQGSTSALVTDSEAILLDAGNNRSSNDPRDLGNKVDDLLFELRKVGRLCFFTILLYFAISSRSLP